MRGKHREDSVGAIDGKVNISFIWPYMRKLQWQADLSETKEQLTVRTCYRLLGIGFTGRPCLVCAISPQRMIKVSSKIN